MQDYQFLTIVIGFATLFVGIVAVFALLWKISSDNRKAATARHKEAQDLRKEMYQMQSVLSHEIRAVGECVARIEGRLDEKQSWRRAEELVQ